MKIGINGFGRMGRNHARVAKELGHDIFVYDIDSSKIREAEKAGYTAGILPKYFYPACDAVIISTPSTYHLSGYRDYIKYATKNLPVLLEKPMVTNINEAKELLNLHKKDQKIVMVNHIERFNPAIVKLKELTKDENIRRISTVRYGPIAPLSDELKKAGVIPDLAVHDIDLARYLIRSDPYEVRADQSDSTCGKERYNDSAHIDMFFGDGVTASIDVSWRGSAKVRRVDVTTDERHYTANLSTQTLTVAEKFDGKYDGFKDLIEKSRNTTKNVDVQIAEPLKAVINHFTECIEKKQQPSVSFNDGYVSVKIIDAAVNSKGNKIYI